MMSSSAAGTTTWAAKVDKYQGNGGAMSKQPLNVLVVEDDPADFMSVERALSGRGETAFSLARADSMESGKRMLEARDFDAVVLDLGLPDSEGVDSVVNFNASAPATPIVVLS